MLNAAQYFQTSNVFNAEHFLLASVYNTNAECKLYCVRCGSSHPLQPAAGEAKFELSIIYIIGILVR